MNQSLVILSGMFAPQSGTNMESKDPEGASFLAADAGYSPRAVEGEFPDTTLPAFERMGSFDYARLRFANSRFAQDDSVCFRRGLL
jgi:hypothetical protein